MVLKGIFFETTYACVLTCQIWSFQHNSYDKSDYTIHNTLYDSYNVEIATTKIGSLKLENTNNNYSISNEIKFHLTNENDKFLMHRQFVAWYNKGCSIVPLTDYANNEVFRELPRLENIYDLTKSDERLYIDLRRGQGYTGELEKITRNDSNLSLKEAAQQKCC